ncbi:MAG: thiamine biosynthesis protein ThiS [Nitrospinae bacterium]|nr:thiamine biosynthesis protein ThiS [Nitrospinota bacterium]
MKLSINVETKNFTNSMNLSKLLEVLKIQINGVAVAINMEIVSRNKYDATILNDGDEIEIVRAVGGG